MRVRDARVFVDHWIEELELDPPDPESVSEFLESRFGHMSGLDMVSLPDMLQVREMLEIPIARLAAENRTEQHLDMLRASIGIRTTADYRRTLTDDGPPRRPGRPSTRAASRSRSHPCRAH